MPPGTVLRPYYGDLVLTTPGATYDALDIHGFVKVKAPDVTIRRSVVRGGTASANTGLVTDDDVSATGLVVEDSELVPEHPSVWIDGLKGGNLTARRVDVHGTVDLVKVHGDHVLVEDSWLHGTRHYASDPNQRGGPSHNDGVQVLRGEEIVLRGNRIEGAANAAVQVTQDRGPVRGLVVQDNWLDGGNCTVNLAQKPLDDMADVVVEGNRFGRGSALDCPLLASAGVQLTASGNVHDDDGTPVAVRRTR